MSDTAQRAADWGAAIAHRRHAESRLIEVLTEEDSDVAAPLCAGFLVRAIDKEKETRNAYKHAVFLEGAAGGDRAR